MRKTSTKTYVRELKKLIRFYIREIPDTATTEIEALYDMARNIYQRDWKGGDLA